MFGGLDLGRHGPLLDPTPRGTGGTGSGTWDDAWGWVRDVIGEPVSSFSVYYVEGLWSESVGSSAPKAPNKYSYLREKTLLKTSPPVI